MHYDFEIKQLLFYSAKITENRVSLVVELFLFLKHK